MNDNPKCEGGAKGVVRGTDRRAQRTQRRLHRALGELIHEKPYTAIAVKEILRRADVGRSTFYAHFNSKDELLLAGMRELLRAARPVGFEASVPRHERLIWFARPLFAHIAGHRPRPKDRMAPDDWAVVHGCLEQALGELVVEGLRRAPGHPVRTPELLVAYVVSSFILVLGWWIERADALGPADADAHFRSLVIPTLSAAMA